MPHALLAVGIAILLAVASTFVVMVATTWRVTKVFKQKKIEREQVTELWRTAKNAAAKLDGRRPEDDDTGVFRTESSAIFQADP